MSRAIGVAGVAMVLLVFAAADVRAQSIVPPGRFEIGGGIVWFGQNALGASDASETTPTGSSSRLFQTSSSLGSQAGLLLQINVRLWRQLEAEISSSFAKPTLSTTISNDLENPAEVTATEPVSQYTVGGGALWYLSQGRSQRLRPYVAGRMSYLRQLHGSNTLAVTGRMYEFGGGVKYALRTRAKGVRTVGVRGDARLAVSTGGVGFDDGARVAPSLAASLFARF